MVPFKRKLWKRVVARTEDASGPYLFELREAMGGVSGAADSYDDHRYLRVPTSTCDETREGVRVRHLVVLSTADADHLCPGPEGPGSSFS